MLTKRQKQILDFVNHFMNDKGYSPSLEEIKRHFRLNSVSTVHEHIEMLIAKGYLNKEENQPRSISPSIKEKKQVEIPVLGFIAAGEPIEAISNPEPIVVPQSMISKNGLHYALRVKGSSMKEEGIYDGDTVIIRRQEDAENGQTVVALVNGNEATLKKIYKERNGFRLQPANSSMKSLFFKELIIQGRAMGVIPHYEDRTRTQLDTSLQIPKAQENDFKMNQIITGDVLEIMSQIPENSIHLAITSPPYNVGKNYDNHNDGMSHHEYLNWLEKVWRETKRVLVSGGRFALNIAPTGIKNFVPLHHDFTNQFRKIGMKFRTEIIWYKQTMLKRTAWGSFKSPANPHIVPSWEYVLIFTKDQDRLDGDSKMSDITKEEFMKFSDGFWKIQPETQRKGHPAPFPEELIYRLIKFYSYKNNNVLDMFGGTGTVAAIAARTGRNFFHIDISSQYGKIAKDRVQKEMNQAKFIN